MILSALILLPLLAHPTAPPKVEGLRCEYLSNPNGIDEVKPRLTWFMTSPNRGDAQTGYQIVVSRSTANLNLNRGDLWDSKKITSNHLGTEYEGKPLSSGTPCFWKVRLWDARGAISDWSRPASWTMGLLHRSDWKAKWITSPILADPANRPRTPINCFRSEISHDPDAVKWITLDLGNTQSIDRVELAPARPENLTFDIGTVQFPRRFRLEAASSPNFDCSTLLLDQTKADYPEPRTNSCAFKFSPVQARYVRLTVTRLGIWDAQDFGIFLGQFSVFSGSENVAVGAEVSASDSIEGKNWSKKFLVTGKSGVEFSAFPTALDPGVSGAFSPSRTTMLRRDFQLDSPVRRATLFSTARGFYEARLNGKRISRDLLAPGFTDFHRRISYETYDVTSMVHKGSNTIAALLGYGWYAGHMNLGGNAYLYGYFPQLAAQLEIEMNDGRRVTISTDNGWRTTLDGPVRWSDLLDGEACDLRREESGWDKPGFASANWQSAWTQELGPERLVAEKTPPVRVIREIKPLSRKEVRPGVWVYDLGQEITGWIRVSTDGPSGTHIRLRHAEAVTPTGELDTASLWGTPQQDDYLLDGKGPHILEPHFTYHGFRYFELSGMPAPPQEYTVVAMNIHTDVEEIGAFECSNPLFNRLMNASRWTQRNLMFDVPAGCAARSERLAWTGDIRPCVQTALFNFDTTAFFEKYSADLRDDQKPDGRFTDICPHAHLAGTDICVGSPGWADAGVSLPWDVYVNAGDLHLLAQHYGAAKRWVDFVHRQNPDGIWRNARGMDWGDWLSAGRATPQELGSTAFFAHSTDLVAQMALALGRREDAATYRALFDKIKAAFVARYVSSQGVIRLPQAHQAVNVTATVIRKIKEGTLHILVNNETLGTDPAPNVAKTLKVTCQIGGLMASETYPEGSTVDVSGLGKMKWIIMAVYGPEENPNDDAQGSYALALRFGILTGPLKEKAIHRLLTVIARDGSHPSTGFWSSVELMLALSDSGQHEVASQMVDLTTSPSWGHMVTSGGTTFWEAFDADKKTLSLNHWTHSSCGEWLWKNVAGLSPDPAHPGYERFTVHPRPTPEAGWCKTTYQSVRGPIAIEWHSTKNRFIMALTVPPGSLATVYIPALSSKILRDSGVRYIGKGNGSSIYQVSSGIYNFDSSE